MSKRPTKRKSSRRRLGSGALSAIGYPSRKKYKTAKPKRKVSAASGTLKVSTSVIVVGASPSTLAWKEVQDLVKRVADRSRTTLLRGGRIGIKVHTLFARLSSRSVLEDGSEEVLETRYLDDNTFPNVGEEWEWRRWFSVALQTSVVGIRDALREIFTDARIMDEPPQFVFIDSIEIQKVFKS